MADVVDGWTRPLGTTGLTVQAITIGTGTFGSAAGPSGRSVPDPSTVELVQAVLDSPYRTLDTANIYGAGASESQIGFGLRAAGGKPDDVLVITKVDPRGRDYSGDRVRTSIDESCARLGLHSLPVVHLHDPEHFDFDVMTASGGAIDALVDLRVSGRIRHLGLAGGPSSEMRRYLDLKVFEVLLVHNRYTLVDRSADDLLEHASGAGLAVFNAAIFGGGILAAPQSHRRDYAYQPAPPATLAAIEQMRDLCADWHTDLRTAAVQFSLRDRRVHSTVIGISTSERLHELQAAAAHTLPDPFWQQLDTLMPSRENWLDGA